MWASLDHPEFMKKRIFEIRKIINEVLEEEKNDRFETNTKDVYQNKLDKGFNVKDINKEFCLTYGEVAEAYEAWRKKKDDVGEEIADVVIYLLGLSEILNVDLESEILRKINKNKRREYKIIDGVNTRVKEYDEK